jgi:hypothetical protein
MAPLAVHVEMPCVFLLPSSAFSGKGIDEGHMGSLERAQISTSATFAGGRVVSRSAERKQEVYYLRVSAEAENVTLYHWGGFGC